MESILAGMAMKIRGIGFLPTLAIVLLFAAGVAAAASVADGPYVLQDAEGKWVAQWVAPDNAGLQAERKPTAIGRPVNVPAVGRLPVLKVRLREPIKAAANEISVPPTTPIFVVADTHGEYEILAELLQAQRIVDRKLRWATTRRWRCVAMGAI